VYCVVFYLYCIPEILKISLVKIHLFIFMVFGVCTQVNINVYLDFASNVYCIVLYLYCIPAILKISLVGIHPFIFMVFGVCTQVNINLDLGFGAF